MSACYRLNKNITSNLFTERIVSEVNETQQTIQYTNARLRFVLIKQKITKKTINRSLNRDHMESGNK